MIRKLIDNSKIASATRIITS